MRRDTVPGDVGYGQVSSLLFAEVGQGRNVAPVWKGVEGQDRGIEEVAHEDEEGKGNKTKLDLESAPATNIGEEIVKVFNLDAFFFTHNFSGYTRALFGGHHVCSLT